MWRELKSTLDHESQERQIRYMVQYLHDQAYALNVYTPVTLYAVNKEVNFVPHKNTFLNLRETSVTENHWSVRGKNN